MLTVSKDSLNYCKVMIDYWKTYHGDPESDTLKTRIIQKPDILNVEFQKVNLFPNLILFQKIKVT